MLKNCISGKKLGFLVLFAGLLLSPALAQDWSDEIEIGKGTAPDLDVDPTTGHLHLIHHNANVIYTEIDPDGNILQQERVDVAIRDNENGFTFSATVAADPFNGRPHLCFREEQSNNNYDIYYTFKQSGGSWRSPLKVVSNELRAYSVRLDMDSQGRAHIIHGIATNAPFGKASYVRVTNFSVDQRINNLNSYRADDRVEISIGADDIVNIILSSPDDLSGGGPVTYYRSTNGGNSLTKLGTIHDSQARGRNGNADVFTDANGNVHFSYGSAQDQDLGGSHSVRYARYFNGSRVRDVVITDPGEIEDWHHSLGIGSVAASDDGEIVVIVYNKGDGLSLRYRISTDAGRTWSGPDGLASTSGGFEGRNKHVVRAKGKTFYLAYPTGDHVSLRILKAASDPPVVNAGGPYNGVEGTEITFDASGTTDDGQVVLYRWDFDGDGVWDDSTNGATTSFVYQDDYAGDLVVEAQDDEEQTSQATAQVTIANAAPVADAGGQYNAVINAPIELSGSVTDEGAQDTHTFKWDLDDNGTFETTGQKVTTIFSSSGPQLVRLRVTDDDGGAGIDTAMVQVGTGGPVISNIPDQTVAENQPFAQIALSDFVTDPDNDPQDLDWRAFGNKALSVRIRNFKATIAVPDSEWVGSEVVSFVATDPDDLSDTTRVKFTVTPINDPPIISKPATQRVDEGTPFTPVLLDTLVFDPDHADEEISWSAEDDDDYIITIIDRILTVVPADSEWAGNKQIGLTATDPEGASDVMHLRYRIDAVNDPPAIVGLENQSVDRGQIFSPINFSELVHDPDNAIEDITLSAEGQMELVVNIDGFFATILPPHADWSGSEEITFTATDSGGAQGSATATFTIVSNNQPPRWASRLDYVFDEDDTLEISLQSLRARVNDPDTPAQSFEFSISGNVNTDWSITGANLNLYAKPDWNGAEMVQFIVFDGDDGTDSVETKIEVKPVADPPRVFSLLNPIGLFFSERPDSIEFKWEATSNPDDPDSPITYIWLFSQDRSFETVNRTAELVDQTEFVLRNIDGSFPAGAYFWKIIARTDEGVERESRNTGSVTLPAPTSVAEQQESIPSSFALQQNYPNPFNPQTTISFAMPQAGKAVVTVYGVDGTRVATLINAELPAGQHQVVWNASGQASGIYIVKLQISGQNSILYQSQRTMSLIR